MACSAFLWHAALSLAPVAAAEEPLASPIQEAPLGDIASPQTAYALQVTPELSWVDDAGTDTLEFVLNLDLGLTSRVQLEVEGSGIVSSPAGEGEGQADWENFELGSSYNVVQSRALGVVLSAGLAAIIPLASGDERATGAEYSMSLYKLLGPLDANWSGSAALELPVGDGAGANPDFSGRSVLSVVVPGSPIVPTLEAAVAYDDETQVELGVGAVVLFSDDFEITVAGVLFEPNDPAWGAVLKLSWQRELAR